MWGLSLGKSDEYWWKVINTWLSSRTDHHIIIFCYMDPPNGILISEKIRKERIAIEKLLVHSNFSGKDKENLRQRIHVIFNTVKVLAIHKIIGQVSH